MGTRRAKERRPVTAPTNVLDGFMYDVSGQALARQIDLRVQFFERQAKDYEAKRDEMEAKGTNDPSTLSVRHGWATLAKNAKNRADFLSFLRDSLVSDVTYRVDDVRLARLDLTIGQLRVEEVYRS